MSATAPRLRVRALTLVEMLIASAILAAVIAAALSLLISTSDDVSETLVVSQLVIDADRVERRIREELSGAGWVEIWDRGGSPRAPNNPNVLPPLAPPLSGQHSCVRYRRPQGYNFGLATTNYGVEREIRFEPSENVTNNVDDNANGLIDEGRLVIYQGTALVAEIARNVATGPEAYPLGPVRGLRADQQYLATADVGITAQDLGSKPEQLRWRFGDGTGSATGPSGSGGGWNSGSDKELLFTFALLARGPAVKGRAQVFCQRRFVRIPFLNTW